MSHRNARLTPHGRRLLVERVHQGMPVAHVAKAMGISRQCAHRWVVRFNEEGMDGLEDRSSRPHYSPRQTDEHTVARVLEARRVRREGPALLSAVVGVSARTISRILREGIPRLSECDPMTGEVIRSSRVTTRRYERARPGELVHVDVKKLGRIPEGGGWRAYGRVEKSDTTAHKRARVGYDYVHSMVDDHSRLAYSEILANETGATSAGFLQRAARFFLERGVERIEAVMTDNAYCYRLSRDFQRVLGELNASHLLIKPHCPWQNGKVERFNRTLQIEWAYRQIFVSNEERSKAFDPWLKRYNYERPHSALGGRPPISRLSST